MLTLEPFFDCRIEIRALLRLSRQFQTLSSRISKLNSFEFLNKVKSKGSPSPILVSLEVSKLSFNLISDVCIFLLVSLAVSSDFSLPVLTSEDSC